MEGLGSHLFPLPAPVQTCVFPPLQKVDPAGNPTMSAHPARFSPDDKFSRQRITLKKRNNLLPQQKAEEPL